MGRHRSGSIGADTVGVAETSTELRLRGYAHDPLLRIGVVVQTLLFGVIGIGTTFTTDGPRPGVATVVTYGVCLSTIPVAIVMSRVDFGIDWWSRRSPLNNWFVVYCELGVATVTATYADPLAALHGVMLLALVGAYAAHFAHTKIVWFHVLWSTTYVLVLGTVALTTTDAAVVPVAARVVVAILVINGSATLLSAFSRAVLRSSRIHLSDAMTDPLTGVLNRRGLDARAFGTDEDAAIARPSVLLVDVDDFKAVNDDHGHSAGDVALRLTAMRLTIAAGRRAVVARLGGDEFIVLVTDPTPNLGAFANRLRTGVHDAADEHPVTVSIGAAPPRVRDGSGRQVLEHTIAAADEALYRAKLDGRNRVALGRPPAGTADGN